MQFELKFFHEKIMNHIHNISGTQDDIEDKLDNKQAGKLQSKYY